MTRIITINRQFASGGREIGKRLADLMGSAYYDKELIDSVAADTGLNPEYIEKYSESALSRSYPYTFGRTFIAYNNLPTNIIQNSQTKIIRDLADKGDCVIIGRAASYLLRDVKPLSVYIYASDMDFRINRCYQKNPLDKNKSTKEMQKEILTIDKQRAKYYEYITNQKWQDINSYHLCLDSSKIDLKKVVNIIFEAVNNYY